MVFSPLVQLRWAETRVGLEVMILCPECLTLAMYLATMKISVELDILLVVWGLSWGPFG